MKTGKKVYIKQLNQIATVSTVKNGKAEKVVIDTPDGEQVVDVLEKGFDVLTGLLSIIKIVIAIIKGFRV